MRSHNLLVDRYRFCTQNMCFECSEEQQLKVEMCQSRHFSHQYVHIFDRAQGQFTSKSGKRCQSCSGLLVNISKIYGFFYYIFWGGLPKEPDCPALINDLIAEKTGGVLYIMQTGTISRSVSERQFRTIEQRSPYSHIAVAV